MALQLRNVAPAQGARWVRDGFMLFGKHPLPFTLMFVVFLATVFLVTIVPWLGGIVMLAALPMLSLGFMVASESALQGGPIHPGQFVAPLRGDPGRRNALLIVCALYAAAMVAIMLLGHWIDAGGFDKLQRLLVAGAPQAEIDKVLAEPGVAGGMLVRATLISLATIPFWHAPALIHWGGQGASQALFSSTLAVWRCRGALTVYVLAWCAVVAVFGAASALLLAVMGMGPLIGLIAFPAALTFSTVFYVSLLFTFNDSFGGPAAAATA